MAMTIYKKGQGYWTRMLTGLGAGVVVLAGVGWLWLKLERYITGLEPGTVLYVQAGVSVALIAVFGLLIYWWVGIKPNSCDFLIATEGEMKKVNWPSQREVIGSTWIVIVFLICFVSLLLLADFLFASFFSAIGVLEIDPFGMSE